MVFSGNKAISCVMWCLLLSSSLSVTANPIESTYTDMEECRKHDVLEPTDEQLDVLLARVWEDASPEDMVTAENLKGLYPVRDPNDCPSDMQSKRSALFVRVRASCAWKDVHYKVDLRATGAKKIHPKLLKQSISCGAMNTSTQNNSCQVTAEEPGTCQPNYEVKRILIESGTCTRADDGTGNSTKYYWNYEPIMVRVATGFVCAL